MKIKIIYINLVILSIIFSHCSNENNEILAIYDNGQLTKPDLINRIGKDKYNKILDSNDSFNTIQQYAFKKIIFDKNTELFNDRSIDDEIARIANDHKLKLLLDHLIKNYSISDSIINYVSKAELTHYTIQDIVVTHRLSYSQNQDRSPKEAYGIAKIIRKRIINKQISFDDAVSIYGEHPSIKLRNGIMGPLPFGVLPKELNDIIWQSEPKVIIGPVGTKFGYHIFQTIKKEDSAVPQEKNRNAIMPLTKTHSLKSLVESAHYYYSKMHRFITFEYVLLKGVNDSPEDGNQLIDLLRLLPCKVNVIPYNEIGGDYSRPTEDTIHIFLKTLKDAPFTVTVRWSKGTDIDAGCGQLAVKDLT